MIDASKIQLGAKVRDRVTEFTGIAVGRTRWLTGCDTILVQPPTDKDGKMPEMMSIDAPRLDVLEAPKEKPTTGTMVG